MNKKILMIIVAVCIFMSTFSFGVFAQDNSVSNEESVNFLTNLGIITTEIENLDDSMSREEFAVYITRMLKLDANAREDVRYFSDVEMDGYAVGAINALVEYGAISVPENRKFRPQDAIRIDEAAKILVAILGYKQMAEDKGGFPAGYLATASSLKLLSGVKSNNGVLSFKNSFDMICNAMEAPLLSIEIFHTDERVATYSASKNDTILTSIWSIENFEDVITAVYGISTDETVLENKNEVMINGETYTLAEGLNADNLVGNAVKVYYKETTKDKHKVIVSLKKMPKTKEINVSHKDFISYKGKNFEFYNENGTIKKIELESPVFVYNGYPLKRDIENTLKNINKGEIILKDTNGNGNFEFVFIKDYKNLIVSAVDNQVVYDKLGVMKIDFKDYDAIRVFTPEGYATTVEDIEIGQSLAVAHNDSGKIIEIRISKSEIRGKAGNHRVEKGTHYITVDSTAYEVDKSYAKLVEKTIFAQKVTGESFKFKLDVFGKIVYMEQLDESMKTGFIVDSATQEDGFDKTYMLKLLTEANKFEELEMADNISINGDKYRKAEIAYKNLPLNGDYGIKQIVRYTVNSDGKINELLTASYNAWLGDAVENKGFQQLYERTESKRYVRGRLGSRAALSLDSVIFFLPYGTNEFEEQDCLVSNYNLLTDDLIYPSNAYLFSRDGIVADAAVVYYENEQLVNNRLYTKPIIMVEDIIKQVNSDGDIVNCVIGYSSLGKVEWIVPDEVNVDGIEEGDIVMFNYDARGNIEALGGVGYTMLCKRSNIYETGKPQWSGNKYDYFYAESTDAVSGNYRAEIQLSFGKIMNVKDNAIAWDRDNDGRFDEVAQLSAGVTIYDSSLPEGERIRIGKAEEVKSYESSQDECAKIVLRTRGEVVVEAFIYQ